MAAAKLRSVRDKEFSVSGALLDTAALGSLADALLHEQECATGK
jgi:hypothetical protein